MAVPEAHAGCLKSSHCGDGEETKRPYCVLNKPGLGNAPLLPSESKPPISAGLLLVTAPAVLLLPPLKTSRCRALLGHPQTC